MKVFIGLVLALLTQKAVFADSTAPAPSAKDTTYAVQKTVDYLNEVAFGLYLTSPDSARAIAEKALLLAEKSEYKAGIGRSFLNIGHVYWSQSYYPMALVFLNKALINLPKEKPLLLAECYELRGRTFAELGNYKDALNNLTIAEKFAGSDKDELAEVHSERSYVYMLLKDYARAVNEAKQSLALNNIAKDYKNTAVIYGRLGSIFIYTKNYKAALTYSDTAYQMSLKIGNNRLRAKTLVGYATIYNLLHQYDKAIPYAKTGAALADSIGVMDAVSTAYQELATSYEQKGDLKQAMAYQKKYIAIKDMLSSFYRTKNSQLIQSYFDLDNRLDAIADFERNAKQIKAKMQFQRIIIISLSLSLLAVIALLLITYYFYKQKKELNDELNRKHSALLEHKKLIEAQTENLQMISKIKDKLLAVIGHDLRTPLANLRNMVEMFEADYLSADEIHWLMKDINPLVKGAELTLSNLMEWAGSQIKGQSINSTRLDIFLLGVEMEQTFNHALHRKNIEFLNQATAGQSVMADENHIKVVLRNLISNAIKFTDAKGTIKLSSTYKENKVIISVQDTGKGMTADEVNKLFYPQTHFSQPGTLGENGTGIGLLLCKELVELNGGKMWANSKAGKGSTFFFSLPLNAEYA
ncbi:MAG: tetratricopeptide repeat-containing sensor histidine kinase [Bacteroidetes bacterium]|jgi:signal transduction histidine kinase|nr:tetratricopeptide repeat-containing sensor histidine kinase [Bacteroidota bacterium]